MCSVDWCYFWWPWVILITPNHPIFHILYRLSYLRSWVEIETSNLVGRLSVAIASPWMVRHPWKWLSHVNHLNFGGHNHIPGTADRLRRCQLSSQVSVINFWRSAAMLITSTVEICIQQLGRTEEMAFTARRSYASAVFGVVILSVCHMRAFWVTNPKNLPAIFLYHM